MAERVTEEGTRRGHRVVAVVPAAGAGLRMGADRPKQYLELGGRPILVRTLEALERCPEVDALVLVVPPGDAEALGRALLALASDPDLRVRLGREAGLRAQKIFELDDMVKKYEKNEAGQYPHTRIEYVRVVSKVKKPW